MLRGPKEHVLEKHQKVSRTNLKWRLNGAARRRLKFGHIFFNLLDCPTFLIFIYLQAVGRIKRCSPKQQHKPSRTEIEICKLEFLHCGHAEAVMSLPTYHPLTGSSSLAV